jgi:hypothetical protein
MHMRAFIMTAAAFCAAATITIGTLASASADVGRKVQFDDLSPITGSEVLAALPGDVSRCTFDGSGNVVSPCVVPVTPTEPSPGAYNDKLTGDFVGTGSFAGEAVLAVINDFTPPDFPFEAYEPFGSAHPADTLHVAGCGTGTLILRKEGNTNSGNGVWQIVPNSGRGGLANISGGGTFSGPAQPDGITPSIYVGRVRCGKHR